MVTEAGDGRSAPAGSCTMTELTSVASTARRSPTCWRGCWSTPPRRLASRRGPDRWFTPRAPRTGRVPMSSDFLAEYGLGTAEGVALLCLAEALLRIPDAAPRMR